MRTQDIMEMGILDMIYVIGDSNVFVFVDNKEFDVRHIGPITAHNLNKIRPGNMTTAGTKIFGQVGYTGLINTVNKENDSIMLVFGEIDCRIHIYYQFMKRNYNKVDSKKCTITELIDNTIHNYGIVMKQLADMNIKFYICGIPPPGCEKNIYNYLWYATPEIHSKIYREFNHRLKNFCEQKSYRYLDIYSKIVDQDGFMKKEYAEDCVHLNNKALPFIVDMIKSYGSQFKYNANIEK